MGFDYPREDAILDPRKSLPPETLKHLEPYYAEGQWRLRGYLSDPPRNEKGAIEILQGIALDVMGRLVQLALRQHANDFDAFRAAIGPDGGAADLGLQYAHFIHADANHGRMPFLWHNPIRDQLIDAISKAENEYWQNYRAKAAFSGHAQARDVAAAARRRKALIEPLLLEKGSSILDWAGNANVDYNTASDYLNGLTNPHRSTLVRLANALGLKALELPL
jgi:hypothetical protein